MKKQICIIILLLTCRICNAQNLVPNPSFENYYNCPTTYGELYQCENWTTFGRNPDYFNSCSPGTIVGVPYNYAGFQYAATGNAYAGSIYNSAGIGAQKEYLGAQLIQPLITGQKYFASLKISSCNVACPTNKIGIRFSTIPFDSLNMPPTNNIAAVYTDSVISDTANWYQIKGSFIADSNYTYVIVGCFFINPWGCALGTWSSYYYLDDVCVSTDSLTCFSTVGINENKQEEELVLFPIPFSDKLNITVSNKTVSEIILYDIASRKLLQQKFTNSVSLNTEQLAKGLYIYEVRNKDGLCKKGKVAKD